MNRSQRLVLLRRLVVSRSFVVAAAVALAIFATPARADENVEDEFLKINSLFNAELYELAAPRYEKFLAAHPDFDRQSTVLYALAVSYHTLASSASGDERRAHLEKAVDHAKNAIKDRDSPSRRQLFEILAQDLLALGDSKTATKVFQALFEKSSGREKAEAAIGLGDAQYHQSLYDDAADYYRQAIALIDGLPRNEIDVAIARELGRSRYQLGLSLYHAKGKEREALAVFEELAGGSSAFHDDGVYMVALTRQKLGDFDAALASFQKLASASSSESMQESGLYGLGSLYFQQEDWAKAVDQLTALRTRFPKSRHADHAALYLGRAQIALGQLREGARLLNELRSTPDVGPEASLWLARTYASRDKHSQAIKIVEAALATFRGSSQEEVLRLERCIELVADTRFEEAQQALAEFARDFPSSESIDHALYLEAYSLHRHGDYQSSNDRCARLVAEHPKSRFRSEVEQLSAENLFLAGNYDEAQARYREMLEDGGARPLATTLLARYRLAEARFLGGDYKGAREALDTLARSAPAPALEKIFADHPVLSSYHFFCGDVAYYLEDWDRAIRELKLHIDAGRAKHAADARFKLAHAMQLSGDLGGARDAYRAALAAGDTPHATQIRFELGQIALQAKDFAAARDAFTTIAASGDERLVPPSVHFLGWIAQQEGKHDEAARWLERFVDKYPQHEMHAQAQYLLALSLQALSRFDDAQSVLDRLEKEHPEAGISAKIRIQQGIQLSRRGQAKEALAVLEPLGKEPLPADLQPMLWYEIAWCHRALADLDSAANAYRAILKLSEASAAGDETGSDLRSAARLELAELEFDRQHIDESKKLLVPLCAPTHSLREKALYRLCWCLFKEGETDALVTEQSRFASAFPSSEYATELALLVARALIDAGEHAKAAERLEALANRASGPEAELADVSLAECFNALRRFDDARTKAASFLDRHPGSDLATRARFALGWALENLGQQDAAVPHYREAARASVELAARAQFQIGQCLAAKKNYEDAIVEFLQVSTRFDYPEWSSRAVLQIAGCFEATENVTQARKYYTRVVDSWPARDEARLAKQRLSELR